MINGRRGTLSAGGSVHLLQSTDGRVALLIFLFFGASASGQELRYDLVFVQAQVACVLADEGGVEDAAGQALEALRLDGVEHARANLGGLRDFRQGHTTKIAFSTEIFPKS